MGHALPLNGGPSLEDGGELVRFESYRRRIWAFYRVVVVLDALLAVILIILVREYTGMALAVFFSVCTALFVFILVRDLVVPPYGHGFKRFAEKELVTIFGRSARYDPEGMIGSTDFLESLLFDDEFNDYRGTKRVDTLRRGVKIGFSELSVTRVCEKNDTSISVFRGMFIEAELPESIDAFIIAIADRVPASMEDPFRILTNDHAVSDAILSGPVMQRITEFLERLDDAAVASMRFSFVDSRFFLAIPFSSEFMVPSISTPAGRQIQYTAEILRIILDFAADMASLGRLDEDGRGRYP